MAFLKRRPQGAEVDFDHLPRHVAIIMDGNGRWAKKRGLPRTAGHAAGAENFRTIATYCKDIGLEYLTVYAFSTENWKRPAEEVSAIMGLLKKYLLEAIGRMERDRVKMEFFGDLSPLTPELRQKTQQTADEMNDYFARGYTPRVKPGKHCNACSLKELCLPALCRRADAAGYIRAHLQETVEGGGA